MSILHIYCNVNKEIGLGHLYRCLSLRPEAAARKIKLYLYINNQESIEGSVRSFVSKIIQVNNQNEFLNEIRKEYKSEDRVLIDGYMFKGDLQTKLRDMACGLGVVADDCYSDYFDCDLLINPNPYIVDFNINPITSIGRVLQGTKYIALKESVLSCGRLDKENKDIKNILVLTGGTDSKDLVDMWERIFSNCTDDVESIEIRGAVSEDKTSVYSNIKKQGFTNILQERMVWADLIVTPLGTAVWEAFYLKRPVFGYSVSDNQDLVYEYLAENGLIIPVNIKDENLEEVFLNKLSELIVSVEKLKPMVESSSLLIDTNGASRILDELWKKG